MEKRKSHSKTVGLFPELLQYFNASCMEMQIIDSSLPHPYLIGNTSG
jgi:hypothetical protein